MDDPIISMKYDINEVSGDYYIDLQITGIKTLEQAASMADYIEKQLCGAEIISS